MNWFDFIFSNLLHQRLRRHAFFWVLWWVYFAGTFFFTQQGFDRAGSVIWISIILTKSLLLLLGHAFMTYTFIYLLLPSFILKSRYVTFAAVLVVSSALCIAWSYFCYVLLFPLVDAGFHVKTALTNNILLWSSMAGGIISALKVLAAATIIKLLKRWYFKQKENERLEKEKIAAELQLLKAQIHPNVLFATLDHICVHAVDDTAKASALLLKLSDLLSFMLYECDQPLIPLAKEIKMIREYVSLQQATLGNRLELGMSVSGDTRNLQIAPVLLLPFIENSFSNCNVDKVENPWIDIAIRIEANELSIKLIYGKQFNENELPHAPENDLKSVYERLEILYPRSHEIRWQIEPEMIMLHLKLKLQEELVVNKKEAEIEINPKLLTIYGTT